MEEKSFKGVDGWMDDERTTKDDRRQVIIIAHPEPCSGELKIQSYSAEKAPVLDQ